MIIYLPSQWCKGYVLALNSPLCCGSASCYGSLFMKHSSAALIQTELRGHAEKKKKEKKKSNKTCCNGNMPALPLSDDL